MDLGAILLIVLSISAVAIGQSNRNYVSGSKGLVGGAGRRHLRCGFNPRDTADQFVQYCVDVNLGLTQCNEILINLLANCHPRYRWFAKVHPGPEETRCQCHYCFGNDIEPLHYDIAGQLSPCLSQLPSISHASCFDSFDAFWQDMNAKGACFVEKVQPPVAANWIPPACGTWRHCSLSNDVLVAFK